MKITAANLQLASTHIASQRTETGESLRMWIGNRRPDFEGRGRERTVPAADRVQLSDRGKSMQSSEADAVGQGQDGGDCDPRLQLIKTLLECLTGRRIEVFDAGKLDAGPPPSDATAGRDAADPPPAAGYGVEYDYHETHTETEQTTFSASGTIHTADGRDIDFKVGLNMLRSRTEERSVSLRLGDAVRMTDPLVLNFSGSAAQLTDTRFNFDIDSDGTAEQVNFAGPGSGFLVLDRNRDGKVNDGKELFGPATGDGFGELAGLDADRNGWIDENDPSFQDLRLWTKDQGGNDRLQPLADAGVGALALTCVKTPFDIKDYAGSTSGQIKSSGVFLQEDGKAGTIQQIDLTI